MLKLANISTKTKNIYNESDFYLKIKILFEQRKSLGKICYWSTGPKNSLIEIGFKYPTGLIFEITVVFASIIHYRCANIIYDNIIKKIGLPLFDTTPWKPKVNPLGYHVEFYEQESYLRDNNDFEIYADEKNTTILFSSNSVILHVINDPIIFAFDQDNNLCYIHIQNIILNEEGFLEAIN